MKLLISIFIGVYGLATTAFCLGAEWNVTRDANTTSLNSWPDIPSNYLTSTFRSDQQILPPAATLQLFLETLTFYARLPFEQDLSTEVQRFSGHDGILITVTSIGRGRGQAREKEGMWALYLCASDFVAVAQAYKPMVCTVLRNRVALIVVEVSRSPISSSEMSNRTGAVLEAGGGRGDGNNTHVFARSTGQPENPNTGDPSAKTWKASFIPGSVFLNPHRFMFTLMEVVLDFARQAPTWPEKEAYTLLWQNRWTSTPQVTEVTMTPDVGTYDQWFVGILEGLASLGREVTAAALFTDMRFKVTYAYRGLSFDILYGSISSTE